MEKTLKFERQMKWGMIAVTVFCAALFLFDILPPVPGPPWFKVACFIWFFSFIMYRAGTFVIKELKRENESLKSGSATDTPDATPPEDE